MIRKNAVLFSMFLVLSSMAQVIVKDINPGAGSSFPRILYPFKNSVVFVADDGFNGAQLYITDGSSSSTQVLTTLPKYSNLFHTYSYNWNYGLFGIWGFQEVGNYGYFFAFTERADRCDFYRTDGTKDGTIKIRTGMYVTNTSQIFEFNNKIGVLINTYSEDENPDYDYLIVYDPSTNNSEPIKLTETFENVICQNYKYENLIGSRRNSFLQKPYIYNNRLYYYLENQSSPDSLFFKSINLVNLNDPVKVHDVVKNSSVNFVGANVIVNDKLIYYQESFPPTAVGNEPYVFDFKTGKVSLLKDINPYFNYNSDITQFINFKYLDGINHTKVFFIAFDQDHGSELWVTDGTSAGTKLVKDSELGTASGFDRFYYSTNSFYRGDTLMIFNSGMQYFIETNGDYYSIVYNNDDDMITDASYAWNFNNFTYLISIDGRIGRTNNGTFSYISSIEDIDCNFPSRPANIIEGEILRKDCKLFLTYVDCDLNTGLELFVTDICNLATNNGFESNTNRINIYPNPTSEYLEIDVNSSLVGQGFEIYNLQGSLVYSSTLINTKTKVNLTKLDKGIYFLKIKGASNGTVKVIKF